MSRGVIARFFRLIIGGRSLCSAGESVATANRGAVGRSLGSERRPRGAITLEDACRRKRLRLEEFAAWESEVRRGAQRLLLSFAQFEREVTGERIRDKIAASKQKGMWMGGNVPLGYDAI